MNDQGVGVKRYRSAALIVALAVAMLVTACASEEGTSIRVVVAATAPSVDGFQPGAPLAGASVRLFRGDTVVLETPLDSEGTASIAPEPGTYTVQVSLDSSAPGGYCFWGDTLQDVSFPQSTVVIEASYICAGS